MTTTTRSWRGRRMTVDAVGATPDAGADADSRRRLLRRRLPGGLFDSGLSSLATFVIGFLAVHYESTAALGAYALALAAFTLAAALTNAVGFTATETAVVRELAPEKRAFTLLRSVPAGARLTLSLGVAASAATLLIPSKVPFGDRAQLAAACVFVCTVSPLQDHIRRMLHIGYDSWGAARVSAEQLASVVLVGALMLSLGLAARPWVPFVVLGVANAVSGLLGLLRVRRASLHRENHSVWPGMRSSFIFGRDLGLSALVNYGCGYATFAIVIAKAGSVSAGEAEGARVLAQPVTVVVIGLGSALGADLMQAARRSDVVALRRLIGGLMALLLVLASGWTAITFRAWSWSPLPELSPSAYVLPGLLLLTVPGQTIAYASGFSLVVAQAVDRLRRVSILQMIASLLTLAVTLLLARHGAWALGWASLAGGVLLLAASLIVVIGPRRWTWLPEPAGAPIP